MATTQFTDALENRGLISSASSMDTAMRWMNQLAGQDADEDAAGLTLYLETAGLAPTDPALLSRIREDLVQTWQGAASVDAAARGVTGDGLALSRSDVTHALGDVETALANAQSAQAVFEAALLELTAHHDADALAGLRVERDLLSLRINDLRDRADALADLRRQMRNPSIS